MKRIIVIFILLTAAVIAFSEEIVSGRHYTLQEVEALEGYTTRYDIPITGRQLIILGTRTSGEEYYEFEPLKMAVLNDSRGNFLDAIGIYRFDNAWYASSFVNETSICFQAQFSEVPVSRFVYVNQFSDSISLFESPRYISDLFTTNEYIIYSTDWDANPIKRISLSTGETASYDGFYPSADLYPLTDDQYIGYLEHPRHEGQQFVLTDTEILKAEKYYPLVTVLRLYNFVSE